MDRSGRIGIIADDMTGALMVAAYYETAGIRAMVVTEIDAIRDCADETIIIWAGRTRLIDPAEACRQADRAAAAFDAVGCDQSYLQASAPVSTRPNRGNIGPIADILNVRYKPENLLFCPGFPKFNATVHQRYLFYRSRLVSESVKRYDPATPMSDPDMVRFIGKQTQQPIGAPFRSATGGRGRPGTSPIPWRNRESAIASSTQATMGMWKLQHDWPRASPHLSVRMPPLSSSGLDRFASNPPATVGAPPPTGGTAAVLVGTVGPIRRCANCGICAPLSRADT